MSQPCGIIVNTNKFVQNGSDYCTVVGDLNDYAFANAFSYANYEIER